MTLPVQTKVCGLSTPETVEAALESGAAFLGFMFFPASPRDVSPQLASRLAAPARGRAQVVAVTVDPDDELVDRLKGILNPDLIQLHGSESPQRVREIAARSGAGAIKAIPVSEAADLDAANAYAGAADYLMFDARTPKHLGRPGGGGGSFDWDLLAGRRFALPWFLAGGLDRWNVLDALTRSGARLADVSSGVERGPGLKDPALITAFLEAVRRA